MSLLTSHSICEIMRPQSRARLDSLEVFAEIESTNTYLLGQASPPPGRYRVALTDNQTAGRGRMDRDWFSPPSTGLCLSMAYTFHSLPENMPSLSLAIGVGIAQVLERFANHDVSVKWPNDIVARGGKLGGVLSEIAPAHAAGVTVVAGIGLNLDFADTDIDMVKRPARAVDLASCCDALPSRAAISAALIESLFDTMVRFETDGFKPFHDMWQGYDWLRGQEVAIETSAGLDEGVVEGVDIDGALLLNAKGDRQRFVTGSVVLNRQAGEHP